MIRPDPLTPCSAGEFTNRIKAAFAELDRADGALCNAWEQRNSTRWPRQSTDIKDMLPSDHPSVIAAEAKIEEARAAWLAAHAKLVALVGAPLELVCAVEDWRVSPWRSRQRCTLPSAHSGPHSFESKPAERPVSLSTRGDS